MTGENVARLFVGIGFLWVVLVLLVGVIGGFDKPTVWLKFLVDQGGADAARYIQWAIWVLTLLILPIGLLTYLRDLFGDPLALWVKAAAPGAFLAIYGLVLVAVLPDLGRPFLKGVESVVGPAVGLTGLKDTLEDTGSWLIRFLAALGLFAGVPGVVGAVFAAFGGGGKPGPRRR